MEYMTALGRCPKCGQDKIQVEGVPTCIMCASENNPGSGLVVQIEDPGAEALEALLHKTGVQSIAGGVPPTPVKPVLPAQVSVKSDAKVATTPFQQGITFDTCVKQAISVLKSASMPKDLKSFKAVNKAIKTLESILGA
jgi:hypothetical protein